MPLLAVAALMGCDDDTDVTGPDDSATPMFASAAAASMVAGSGNMWIDGVSRTFAFNARVGADGAASGQFELHARQADARIHGEITCATIWGRSAWLGGRITTEGDFYGQDAIFRVVDFGEGVKGQQDLISLLGPRDPGFADFFCATTPFTPPAEFPVDGAITVKAPGQSSFTQMDRVEVPEFWAWVECADNGNGELVVLSGSMNFLYHFTEDPAGGGHWKWETNPNGLAGFGQTSGDRYVGTGVSGGQENVSLINFFPFESSFVDVFQIIGQGTAPDLRVHYNGHVTAPANGDFTTFVSNFRYECG